MKINFILIAATLGFFPVLSQAATWKPLCVNGGNTSGAHNNTWQKINTPSTRGGTWKPLGGCIVIAQPTQIQSGGRGAPNQASAFTLISGTDSIKYLEVEIFNDVDGGGGLYFTQYGTNDGNGNGGNSYFNTDLRDSIAHSVHFRWVGNSGSSSNWSNFYNFYSVQNTCFPSGSQVLMGDGIYKNIEEIVVGDMVMGMDGPTKVIDFHTPLLGVRRLLRFVGTNMTWSEEHAMWTKRNGSQWWWSANTDMWKSEAEQGIIGGLFDNDSILSGSDNIQWAHLSGWKNNEIEEIDSSFNTQLYLPITSGSPIIVNGYVVGAGVNQSGFDYTTLDWDIVRHEIEVKIQ